MLKYRIDNGGQGCIKTVMANQTHDVGEPLKMDDAKLRRLIAIGEPLSRNWRVDSYLYEGMATEWFHVWETGDGYGVYSTECLIEEYDTKEEALCVMRHEGRTVSGYDLGWSVALPVGHGGLPDEWFVGWRPLP